MAHHVALVAGASGLIGSGLVAELERRPEWSLHRLAKRESENAEHTAVDLGDAEATVQAMKTARDTTHLFYAAYRPKPSRESGFVLGSKAEQPPSHLVHRRIRKVHLPSAPTRCTAFERVGLLMQTDESSVCAGPLVATGADV